MDGVRKTVKKVTPKWLLKPALVPYHYSRGLAASLMYGRPARGMKVIAVTGTNGKTTTVNYIASILMAAGYRVGISTTALFRIGDEVWDNELNMTVTNPFSLNKLLRRMRKAKLDFVVLEVTSHSLHQKRVLGVPVHTAVMTNLTQDHLDYHGTMKDYAAAKGLLLKRAKHNVVLNRDDDWFPFFYKLVGERTLFTYGVHQDADVRMEKAKLRAHGSKILVRFGGEQLVWQLQLTGKFNVYNALAAAATASALAIPAKAVAEGLAALRSVPGRMEAVNAGQPFSVIVDYAHAPDALENVFETLRPITDRKLIAVYGAMGDRDRTKRPLMGQIGAELCDEVIITDEEWYTEQPDSIRKAILKGAKHTHGKAHVQEIADRHEAIKAAFKMAKLGDTVAILGLGHQKYRVLDGKKEAWDDRVVARELLDELHLSKKS